jgi:hypothetical protein
VFGDASTTGQACVQDRTLWPRSTPGCPNTTAALSLSYSNHLKFEPKDDPCPTTGCQLPITPQRAGTISYPFPRVTPDPQRLYDKANQSPNVYWSCAVKPCSPPPWTTAEDPGPNHFFDSGQTSQNRFVFIDANGRDLTFQANHGKQYKGVLIVWCGTLRLDAKFNGIILTLYGNGAGFGATDCSTDPTRGRFTIAQGNQDFSGWMYANGGTGDATTPGLPGITLEDDTKISPLNSGSEDLASQVFGTTTPSTPNNFTVQGWRELYSD